jgi:hypothetical protein
VLLRAVWVDVEVVGHKLLLPSQVDVGTHDLEQRDYCALLSLSLVRAIALRDRFVVQIYRTQEPQPWVIDMFLLSKVRKKVSQNFDQIKVNRKNRSKIDKLTIPRKLGCTGRTNLQSRKADLEDLAVLQQWYRSRLCR